MASKGILSIYEPKGSPPPLLILKKILRFAQSIFMNSVWTPGQSFPYTALIEWLYDRIVAIPRYELNI